GVIGNSPRAVSSALLAGKLLLFHSTNFGSMFTELTGRVAAFNEVGGLADMYVLSFANVDTLADRLRANCYDRLFIATGGFYDVITLEDMVVGGDLLIQLGLRDDQVDDEARTMMACARAISSDHARIAAFQSNWIGRCLTIFNVEPDIGAA